MAVQQIPVTSAPNQTLIVSLIVDGQNLPLRLQFSFNEMAGWWVMAVNDQFGTAIILSVPLLTGVYPAANILGPYQYLGIGSAFVINASGTTEDYPDATNLGTDFILIWDDTAA